MLEGLERNTARGAAVVKPKPPQKKNEKKRPKTLEEEFLDNYEPPFYRVNKYVWWASGVVAVFLAWYSTNV